jgi:hypothetical protein
MSDLLRETAFGQFLRFVSRRRLLRYPEELSNFVVPSFAPQNTSSQTTTVAGPTTNQEDPEALKTPPNEKVLVSPNATLAPGEVQPIIVSCMCVHSLNSTVSLLIVTQGTVTMIHPIHKIGRI